MSSKQHWETVYRTKASDAVSWHQANADISLELIDSCNLRKDACLIDVGGGASTLTDGLRSLGYKHLSVLDLSAAALSVAKTRLGENAKDINWIEADITQIRMPEKGYDLWHDRAVFHFLTDQTQRDAYKANLLRALKPHGHVIISTFADDGPTQCSNLPVVRYSPKSLSAEFSQNFMLIKHREEIHKTPSGVAQSFVYCHLQKK